MIKATLLIPWYVGLSDLGLIAFYSFYLKDKTFSDSWYLEQLNWVIRVLQVALSLNSFMKSNYESPNMLLQKSPVAKDDTL